jgi:hypothetical protein
VSERVKSYLGEPGARYEVVVHDEGFSAGRMAQESHIPGRWIARVVVVRDEREGP